MSSQHMKLDLSSQVAVRNLIKGQITTNALSYYYFLMLIHKGYTFNCN